MSVDPNAGLAGINAGSTAISTVGQAGVGLSYRGYSIEDLARQSHFEEVAYLLLYKELPSQKQLKDFTSRLQTQRELPTEIKRILQQLPANSHPMNVMQTACAALGCVRAEHSFSDQARSAEQLLAMCPLMLLYWYNYHHQDGAEFQPDSELSYAAYFLQLLHRQGVQPEWVRALDVSLILYAEHEFNASTFAARVAASTLTDMHSAVCAAVGTLRGPLHGGANEAAMALIERYPDEQQAEQGIMESLATKEKIMGFGHRVYHTGDPRSPIIKQWARQLATSPDQRNLVDVSERIEQVMWREKKLFPNLDFYSASAYRFLGIPVSLYTPVFVCSRMSGWLAHIMEQREHNRLIRPGAEYVGEGQRSYVPLKERD